MTRSIDLDARDQILNIACCYSHSIYVTGIRLTDPAASQRLLFGREIHNGNPTGMRPVGGGGEYQPPPVRRPHGVSRVQFVARHLAGVRAVAVDNEYAGCEKEGDQKASCAARGSVCAWLRASLSARQVPYNALCWIHSHSIVAGGLPEMS